MHGKYAVREEVYVMAYRQQNNRRPHLGKSLIGFPKDYVMVDIETTGLKPYEDEILELSAIRVRDNQIERTFSSLIQPTRPISSFITRLTGISNFMVATAPTMDQVLPTFLDFIRDDIIVGYNVNFDLSFIYDTAVKLYNYPVRNDYIDVLTMARKLVHATENHKLGTTAKFYEVSYEGAHRGLTDCFITIEVMNHLHQDALIEYGSEQDFKQSFYRKTYPKKVNVDDLKAQTTDFNPDHPLFDKIVVFSGDLVKMTRESAMQAALDKGANLGKSVTLKTDYLIVSQKDLNASKKSSKFKKAEEYANRGEKIKIIAEKTFLMLLDMD
jgi:DNA polymerase-3 subunit epsilon